MFLAAISLLSKLTILPYFYFAVFLFCGITEIWGCNVPLVWGAVWRILPIGWAWLAPLMFHRFGLEAGLWVLLVNRQ